MLVTVNSRLILEIEIIHDLSCHPIVMENDSRLLANLQLATVCRLSVKQLSYSHCTDRCNDTSEDSVVSEYVGGLMMCWRNCKPSIQFITRTEARMPMITINNTFNQLYSIQYTFTHQLYHWLSKLITSPL